MRITLIATGRLRAGPEADLVSDYLDRFARTGRAIGLPAVTLVEIDDRKSSGMQDESARIARALPEGAAVAVLDERGEMLSSPAFATRIAHWRDSGRDLALVIGGADGLDPALRKQADLAISLGPMVWPHMLARVMLAEQLYRAATILAGTPYHRA